MGWFRKKSRVPEREFQPEDLAYPFAFPVIELNAGSIFARETPASFGLVPAKAVSVGRVDNVRIASADGSLWRPVAVSAVCRTGKRLFGQDLLWAEFSYERLGDWALADLQQEVSTAVEQDPDDIWDQIEDHDTVLAAIRSATTFDDLVRAIADVGGQGSRGRA